jgi:cell division protein FtsI/penicillin-binding protein 2
MRDAVRDPGGTLGHDEYELRGYSIAAKTGTAQIREGYSRDHAWIAGFGPFPEPKFAFVVVLEESPLGGGKSCHHILQVLLDYLARECPELSGRRLVPSGEGESE